MDLNSKEVKRKNGYNVALGMETQLSSTQTLSMSARGILNQANDALNSLTDIYQANPTQFSQILSSKSIVTAPSNNYTFNIDHLWKTSANSSINTSFNFGTITTDKSTQQPNTFFEPDGITIIKVQNSAFDANTAINLWSGKMDYEKEWKNITLSSGIKYGHVFTKNTFAFYDIPNGISVPDPTKSNDFNYSENVAALYGIVNVKLSANLKLNTGLRIEHTSSRGQLISNIPINDKDVPRNYTDLFPNVALSYDNQKNHSWSISLGRRITRPNYQDLNPFEKPLSQLVVWKGNPFLRPNYIINYQVSYAFKQKLIITNSYSVTKDFFASIFEVVNDKGNQIIPRNMKRATNFGLSVSYPLIVNKFWDFVSFADGSFNTFKGNLEGTVIDIKATLWSVRLQNNFKLPKGITMDISYRISSDWIWRGSIKVRGNQGLSFGIRKDFLDKKLQLRLTGSDIFRTDTDYFYKGNYGGILLDGMVSFDNRRFGGGLTWKFGNQKLKIKKKASNGLDDELNRL